MSAALAADYLGYLCYWRTTIKKNGRKYINMKMKITEEQNVLEFILTNWFILKAPTS